jgi:hypothetical protein
MLSDTVRAMINQGWEPFGSLSVYKDGNSQFCDFVQAMVRYETAL